MKQIQQSLRNGEITLVDIPAPVVSPGTLLIRTQTSLLSVGTEKMLLDFGKAGFVEKARQQPDKVRQVIDKVKTDGLATTWRSVSNRLDTPLTLGYSNVGKVVEVGAGVVGFSIGDRVVSNGAHAELVLVPKNLCAIIPDEVSDEAAAFAVVGAIGLQGVRLAAPTFGERFMVIGLGLIGLLTAQILRAHGCSVLGVDLDEAKLKLARSFGVTTVNAGVGEDPVEAAKAFSGGLGLDGVLICASTGSDEPVRQAAQSLRTRGRIVLVGVTGLKLSRDDFYKKELSFQVSCSYGPGRYDVSYEEQGHDYPPGFVRWTEQRNFTAILGAMAAGSLDTSSLITHRYEFDQAQEAYGLLGSADVLGLLFKYPGVAVVSTKTLRVNKVSLSSPVPPVLDGVRAGFIGAGNYASQILIPAFREGGADIRAIVSQRGTSAAHAAKKYGIPLATTDADALIADPSINTVVIATRHDSHAELVIKALLADKHVFVEKPLALNRVDLDRIRELVAKKAEADNGSPLLTVGFNRRFAPHVVKMADLLRGSTEPKTMIMTVNAGAIPPDVWVHDPQTGGGRIIGEGCHFIDLLRFMAGSPISAITGVAMAVDTATFTLSFVDGSIGTVHYFANGHRSYAKERLEIFSAGKTLVLDNFRTLAGYGYSGFKSKKLWRQDKGNNALAKAFIDTIEKGGRPPIPLDELLEVSEKSIEIAEVLRS